MRTDARKVFLPIPHTQPMQEIHSPFPPEIMNLVLLQLLSLLCVAYASKRELTVDERFRCMEEVSEVERLRVHYAVAVTVHGFPLAVYSSGGGQEDYVSHSLLSTGHWGGSVAHDALELAKLVAAGMTPQQRACVSPPCHPYAAVDIGANVGWWTFTAAHAGFQVCVVTFFEVV